MSKSKDNMPPFRLSHEEHHKVFQLVNATGWSGNTSLAFIVNAGWNALNGAGTKIPAMQEVMKAAVAHCETQRAMEKRLAMSAKKLRDAKSVLGGVK